MDQCRADLRPDRHCTRMRLSSCRRSAVPASRRGVEERSSTRSTSFAVAVQLHRVHIEPALVQHGDASLNFTVATEGDMMASR